MLPVRPLGRTALTATALGFGAGHIGSPELAESEAGALLHEVLDLGITLIDTARGYGLSEERIGRHVAHRRSEYTLVSKGGYGVEGVEDWTPASVTRGVDDARASSMTARIAWAVSGAGACCSARRHPSRGASTTRCAASAPSAST